MVRAPVRPPREFSILRTETSTRACWQKAGADFTTLTARGSPSGGRRGGAWCCCCSAAAEEEEFAGAKGKGIVVVVEEDDAEGEGEGGGCGNVADAARAAAAAMGVSDRTGMPPSPGTPPPLVAEGEAAAEGPEAEGAEALSALGQATAVALTTCPNVPLPSRSSMTYARPLEEAISESPTRMIRSECSLSRPALEAGSEGVVSTLPKFGSCCRVWG